MATDTDKPVLLAVVADTHINSTVGLCPPTVPLEKGTHRATKAQRAVWRAWKDFWHDRVYEKARAIGARVWVVIAGDANDKNKHDARGSELITTLDEDIKGMTVLAFEPMLEGEPEYIFVIRGTEAHTGKAASLEEAVAKDIGAEPDEQEGTHSWWWLPLDVNDVVFDTAHHPETFARRPWTVDAAAPRCARIIRERYLDRGEKPPDVAIRAHVHKYIPSGKRLKPQMFYLPPWQLTASFHRRLGATAFEAIGGMTFICQNGEYKEEPHLWRPPILKRKPWKPS